jgi:hypothetical protein
VEALGEDDLDDGGFLRGSHYTRGWRRGTAALLALIFLLPIAIALLTYTLIFIARLIGW